MRATAWSFVIAFLVWNLPGQLVLADGPSRGTPKTIVGEVIAIDCYIREGGKSQAYRACAEQSLKKGLPVGILESGTGLIYLAAIYHRELAGQHGEFEPANAVLLPLLDSQIRVAGLAATQGTTHMIAIEHLEPVRQETPPSNTKYVCPMHPEVVQDQPGSCPKCGMMLKRGPRNSR